MTYPCRLIFGTLAIIVAPLLSARELVVDARGGADYSTLTSAAAAVQAGDTLVIAKGSGPYRETLYIKVSGQPNAPVLVEGNGETITGFDPLVFKQDGEAWTARLPQAFPVVITYQGKRILQDPVSDEFLGPIKLLPDNRTVQLLPGASPQGWEASARDCPVRIVDSSHQTYRNIIATGGTNDGYNIHGKGEGLRFENIIGANNLDEGFSAHDDTTTEIKGGDFWGNDNGISNNLNAVMTATGVRIYDNIGWGLGFSGNTVSHLTDLRIWGNGMAQVRFEGKASGSCDQVLVWQPTWTTRPWKTYKESSTSKAAPTAFRGDAEKPSPDLWKGFPQLATTPPPTSPTALAVSTTPKASPTATPSPATPKAAPTPAAKPSAAPASTSATSAPAANLSTVNFTRLIRDAVKAGQPTLRLPAGTYRIDETIVIADARNLEIDGTGVTLVMTSRRRGIFYLSNSDRLTIRGLTLDYDPLPFTQGKVTKADGKSFEFEIHDGYPDIAADYAGAPAHLFTPEGKRHTDAMDFYKPRIEVLSPRKGIAHTSDKWPASLAPGDQVVFDRRGIDRANAIEVRNNTGPVVLEDFNLLSSPALGVAGRYCEAPVIFRRFFLRPGPLPVGATAPRLFSTNADAINFVQCRQGPVIENCEISHQGDDALNVHGVFLPVSRVVSPTRFLTVFPHGPAGFTNPMRAGDSLRLYSENNFALAGTANFKAIQVVPGDNGFTKDDVKKLYPAHGSNEFTVYQVDLTEPAPLVAGQWFDSPAVNGDGYIVRNSYFHDNRGRGLRLMASNGLVENNRFERLTKSAISIGPELGYWREAGWVKNLRITGNSIRDIGVDASLAATGSYVPGAIGIFVRTENGKPPYPAGNEDIVIENNTIDGSSVAGIHAYAVRGLTIRNNTLKRTNLTRSAGATDPINQLVTTGPISTEGVAGVVSEWNTITPPTAR